jgi:monofunctional biosynthetic peptidoglycan transglycosylase
MRGRSGRGQRDRRRAGPLRRVVRLLVLALLGALLAGLAWEAVSFPDVSLLRDEAPPPSALMRYREQQASVAGRPYRRRWTYVPLSRISPHLSRAVIAAEDSRFFQHHGFDARAIDRALSDNLAEGRIVRGGSTISQQLAKNLYLSPRRSLTRKFHEALYTYALERKLDKQRILELYLNLVEWGDGVFGAEQAAQAHFGRPASALTRRQAAALAVCLPSPLKRDPNRPTPGMQRQLRRVLKEMARMERRESFP